MVRAGGIVEAIRLVVATGIIIFPRQREGPWSHREPVRRLASVPLPPLRTSSAV